MFKFVFKATALSVFLSTAVFADITTPSTGDTDIRDFNIGANHTLVEIETLSLSGTVFNGGTHTVTPTGQTTIGTLGVSSTTTDGFSGVCNLTADTASGTASNVGANAIGALTASSSPTGDRLVSYNLGYKSTQLSSATPIVASCNGSPSAVTFQPTGDYNDSVASGDYSDTVTITLTIG